MTKKKYELLLVDDELANLQKLQRTFMGQYTVHLAQSGEEALADSSQRRRSMRSSPTRKCPDMTGIEFLELSQKSIPESRPNRADGIYRSR